MDVSDASYYIHENNENKGSQMGHTKKILKKKKEFPPKICRNLKDSLSWTLSNRKLFLYIDQKLFGFDREFF
jgi:hypothetical protein